MTSQHGETADNRGAAKPNNVHSDRPPLDRSLSEFEFKRWYWTMAELQPFARELGVAASGPKLAVTERISAALAGRHPGPATPRRNQAEQISGQLSVDTAIPEGQRSTTELRRFFESHIGPSFRFNGHMRAFLLAGGATLGDAIRHWYVTLGTPLPAQSESLEFNRFTRAWHAAHPAGTASECRAAWAVHRALPVDQRTGT